MLVRLDIFLAMFLAHPDDRVNIHGIVMGTGMEIIDRNAIYFYLLSTNQSRSETSDPNPKEKINIRPES